ncbi:MAG: phosphate transport regulator [Deltaproteobacteria bacterium]|nr:phosphate transport regulator [Deltaproteobacteria bacterium]
MLERLLPRKNEFFALFSRHATLCVDGAGKLREMLDDLGGAEQCAAGIHVTEHEADGVCQQTMELLHTSFITPIERGDIYSISSRLDDILDHIEAAAQNLWLYEVSAPRPEALEMAGHLVEATLAMKATVDALAKRPTSEHVRELCRAVKQVEKQNDRLLRRATARLFKEEQDSKNLIKWKEIFENIESAIDRCEDVANVIEGVALENA